MRLDAFLRAIVLAGLGAALPAGAVLAVPLYYTFEGEVTLASPNEAGIGVGDTVRYVFRIDPDPTDVSSTGGSGMGATSPYSFHPPYFYDWRETRTTFDAAYVGGDFLPGEPPAAPAHPLPTFGDGTSATHVYRVTTFYETVDREKVCYFGICVHGHEPGDAYLEEIEASFALEHLYAQGGLWISARSEYAFSPTAPEPDYAGTEHHPADWEVGDSFVGRQDYYYGFSWIEPFSVWTCVDWHLFWCGEYDLVTYGNEWSYETGTILSSLTLTAITAADPLSGAGEGGGGSHAAAVPAPPTAPLVAGGALLLLLRTGCGRSRRRRTPQTRQ